MGAAATPEARLRTLGVDLPGPLPALTGHAPLVVSRGLAFVSGHGPLDGDRRPVGGVDVGDVGAARAAGPVARQPLGVGGHLGLRRFRRGASGGGDVDVGEVLARVGVGHLRSADDVSGGCGAYDEEAEEHEEREAAHHLGIGSSARAPESAR